MLYFELRDGHKLLVLEPGNIQHLQDGENVLSPDGSVALMFTPDIVWLSREIVSETKAGRLTGELLDTLHAESMKRTAPADQRDYHPMEQLMKDGLFVEKVN